MTRDVLIVPWLYIVVLFEGSSNDQGCINCTMALYCSLVWGEFQ